MGSATMVAINGPEFWRVHLPTHHSGPLPRGERVAKRRSGQFPVRPRCQTTWRECLERRTSSTGGVAECGMTAVCEVAVEHQPQLGGDHQGAP